MSGAGRLSGIVRAVERLVFAHFRTMPFHNLHLLYGAQARTAVPEGGTCSEKTLSFLAACRRAGFDAALHSGFIGGREIHRLARIRIGDRLFFADVGNGWPAVKLYPADREISHRRFGMGFRTEVANGRVRVFHERRGGESLQLEIDAAGKPEPEIVEDIGQRLRPGAVYPFTGKLRFAMIVGDRFLFLRGDRLEIYGDDGFESVEGIDAARMPEALRRYFGYDVGPFLGGRGPAR